MVGGQDHARRRGMCSRPEPAAAGRAAGAAAARNAAGGPVDERVDAARGACARGGCEQAASPPSRSVHRQRTHLRRASLRCRRWSSQRSVNGALAGAVGRRRLGGPAAARQAGLRSGYDDVELLGKLVTRGDAWPAAGLGAPPGERGGLRGRLRAGCGRSCPGPAGGAGADRGADRALRPCGRWPAGGPLPPRPQGAHAADRQPRALAQATWRHVLFGAGAGRARAAPERTEASEPPPCRRRRTATATSRSPWAPRRLDSATAPE